MRRDAVSRVSSDANVAYVSNPGEEVEVSHPTDDGDCSFVLTLSPRLVTILRPESHCLPPGTFVTSDRMDLTVRGLAYARSTDPQHAEEIAMGLIYDLLDSGTGQRPGKLSLRSVAQRELVEDTKALLAANVGRNISLVDLGAQVGCAPHHLSRIFHRHTRSTITQYRLRLRARLAISMILEGAEDLATVAVAAGFADHAHLSRSIRQLTGSSPSSLRTSVIT